MFSKFFYTLKDKGLEVSLGEWLDLQEALDKGLCESSLVQFYYVARMTLVKSETEFDKFDMAFEECFKGVKMETEVGKNMLKWLDKSDMMELAHEEARNHLNQVEEIHVDKEDVERTFKQRLKDQNEEHNGEVSGLARWVKHRLEILAEMWVVCVSVARQATSRHFPLSARASTGILGMTR